MGGKIYSGTYTTTIVLTSRPQQNPATLTGAIMVNGTNAASDSGFYSDAGGSFSITNLGRITVTGDTSYGILLRNGGTIHNGGVGTAGYIRSDETGILLSGSVSTLVNDGSIIGALGRGVFLQDGGTLTNGTVGATYATIEGGFEGVAIYNANGLLTNSGSILDTGTAGLGVELYAGLVNNMVSGLIEGVYGVGFVAQNTAGTLTNAGSIIGTGRDGVALSAGGTVTNSGGITGAIAGILALAGTTTVTNSGSIAGGYAGIDLLGGGSVNNQSGGRISGGFGVSMGNGPAGDASGTVTNAGVITAGTYQGVSLNEGGAVINSGSIYGASAGVAAFYGAAYVTNTGSIGGGFIGVDLGAGGSITNAAGATIAGGYGIVLENGPQSGHAASPFTLTNAGQITGSGRFGVDLLTNGSFANQAGGTISGGQYGVYIGSVTGMIGNYGVISAHTGIYGRAVVANGQRYTGQLTIINAGTITGTGGVAVSMFSSHDLLIDRPGAVFNGGVIAGGGMLELAAGGTGTIGTLASALPGFSTITADAGANWSIAGTISATGTLVDLGTLTVQNGATLNDKGIITGQGSTTGTVDILRNATLAVSGTIQSDISVAFADSTGHLSLTSPLTELAPISGFSAGDTIYLPNTPITGLSETWQQGLGGGTLTLNQDGSVIGRLNLIGTYSTGSFSLKSDPNGGADIFIPCFLAGTRIAVPDGELAVERLRPGMMVLTAAGQARRIVWVGHRVVDVAAHAQPQSVRPVRIAAHAFGHGRPARDLLLSPDHAIWHEGVLVPAQLLINGRSIRLGPIGIASYYHVELASHDLLLAEGLAVESYLDTGNREFLGAASTRGTGRRCAPLVLTGARLARARRHLLVHAEKTPCPAPDIRVEVAGNPVHALRTRPGQLLFRLPPLAPSALLIAPAPCTLAAALLDGQALGTKAFGRGFKPDPEGGRIILSRAELHLARPRPEPRSLELILA
jgi:collagen type I/II/III/V/XI/XXIV/XXVII alpha